jgi:hypothetical protein
MATGRKALSVVRTEGIIPVADSEVVMAALRTRVNRWVARAVLMMVVSGFALSCGHEAADLIDDVVDPQTAAELCRNVTPSGTAETDAVGLTGSITRTTIPRGETATFTYSVTNRRPSSLTLTFYSGCQIVPYIVNCSTATTVYPRPFGCSAILSSMELAPNGSFERSLPLDATTYPFIALEPGVYAAHAKLMKASIDSVAVDNLRSDPVVFTVTR